MSLSFEQLLQRAIGNKRGLPAKTAVDIVAKGLSLKGTFLVRMEEEIPAEDLESLAEKAALAKIEDLLDGKLSSDILAPSFFKNLDRTRNTGKVEIPTKAIGLQLKDGRFISSFNLAKILNITLAEKLKERMVAPKLVWRTGRFANSAKVTKIDFLRTTPKNNVSIFFTYMTYPYGVFETHPTRNPVPLIADALDAAIRETLNSATQKRTRFTMEML